MGYSTIKRRLISCSGEDEKQSPPPFWGLLKVFASQQQVAKTFS
jgi:hypothetical protein